MLTELRVLRSSGRAIDVVVDHDARATVGCVADAIADHLAVDRGLTVQREGLHRTAVDRSASLVDSGLHRGDVVRLVPAPTCVTSPRPAERQLALTIVDGPQRGRIVPLRSGVHTIGRGSGMDVRLDDDAVSRHHADLLVGWLLELTDRRSANGTQLDGVAVDGTVRVEPGARLRMGDTTLMVTTTPGDRRADVVEVNRPPRIVRDHEPVSVRFPTPPDRRRAFHFPWISLVAGLAMGGAFMALSGGALRTGAFYLLMPLLLVAGAVEARAGGNADHTTAVREWRETVVERLGLLRDAEEAELAAAAHRHPPTEALGVVLESMGTRIWEREPHRPDFLRLRVGAASLPTTNAIEAADSGTPELRAELMAQIEGYRHVDDMPMLVDLAATGHVGIAGRSDGVAALARSLALQVAIMHSPAEVALALMVDGPAEAEWEWAKWLPHLRSGAALLGGEASAVGIPAALAVLGRIEALVAQRAAAYSGSRRSDSDALNPENVGLPAVAVVYDAALGIDRARMNELLAAGPSVGVHVVWMDEAFGGLPSRAGASVVVRSDGLHADVGLVSTGQTVLTRIETTTTARAEALALRLAPLVDAANRLEAASDLPASLTLAALLGEPGLGLDDQVVERRWGAAANGLHAAIGVLPSGRPLTVDLRRDGPHALVAGTTGSGKSELLQTLIAGLASAHPPSRVNFLLVDFKGGAAFAGCAELPHTVGMVTDLDPAGTRRVLVSLEAELRRREHLLAAAGARDLAEMEGSDPSRAPASLVVVIDEFAALSREVPELIDGVVDIAQRGRSLGLHLVLATQRPAGVVTEAIRANTNLRIALRVADAADSLDIVGSPLAAAISRSTPGRAVVRVGAEELHVVQSAWAGARSSGRHQSGGVRVSDFRLGGSSDAATPAAPAVEDAPTDLHRLAAMTSAVARRWGLAAPFRPWRDPLPERLDLDALDLDALGLEGAPWRLPFGLVDLPDQQSQVPAAFDLPGDGHLAVVGASGAGTTTLLRTLAAAATRMAIEDTTSSRGATAPIRVDVIDASGRGLAALEGLPVVGSVLDAAGQVEQVLRLLRMLRAEVEERAAAFATSGVGELGDHRASGGAPLPRRLLLIDGFTAFHDLYDGIERGVAIAIVDQLLADGRRAGIHLVLAADRPTGVAGSILRAVRRKITLGPAEDDVSRSGVPGRGLLDGREVQVAVVGGDPAVASQHAALRALAQRAVDVGVPVASPVPVLPTDLPRATLAATATLAAVVVGRLDHDLEPATVDLTAGPLCIYGTPSSGKSTALRSIAEEVRSVAPSAPIVFLAAHREPRPARGPWNRTAVGIDECLLAVEQLSQGPGEDGLTLCIDDLPDLLDEGIDAPLLALLRRLDRTSSRIVVAGDATRSSGWSDSMRRLRSARRGLLLVPHLDQHGELLGVELPRTTVSDMTPGRGFVVERKGRPSLVQLCRPHRH